MDLALSQKHEWQHPWVVNWTQWLLNSYRYWTGKDLIDRTGNELIQCERLFLAPFVVVSHDTRPDPYLNYGNHAALQLWEMDWNTLRNTPSRLTAEPMNQQDRARMLKKATELGIIPDYRGIRISQTGHRFLIEHATVWNVQDKTKTLCGQAATFDTWSKLPLSGPDHDPLCNP